MLPSFKKWLSKEHHIGVVALIISLIALGAQVYFLPYQISGYKLDKKYKELDAVFQSADILKKYGDDLNSGINGRITDALNNGEPLFKANGGNFDSNQMDKFLGVFNTINDLYEKDLISSDDITNEFSDIIIRAYKNKEIQDYLTQIRKEDPTYFKGFDYLQEDFGEN